MFMAVWHSVSTKLLYIGTN